MTTREIAETYFKGWTTNHYSDVRHLLADDVSCWTPMNQYTSAKALAPALERFVAMMKSAKLQSLIVEGDRVALVYDCELPFGTLHTAEVQRIEGGKIRSIELIYDATNLRGAMPPSKA